MAEHVQVPTLLQHCPPYDLEPADWSNQVFSEDELGLRASSKALPNHTKKGMDSDPYVKSGEAKTYC